ncbi:tyrosine-type recombinase/integrase [Rufibacter sediminis]|uniref:Site-specific integrase n=1 Tax=Rufibacter sediminis TaxID=2762756 RepID=A0ABR6VRH8_9BACT|nr:site-specific integrase [Rufibacter sediminis]MBC3539810.1 site-specific integrase [Rufibacter sediminis]
MGVALRAKKTKEGKEKLYLDIYHNGKRETKFFPFTITNGKDAISKKEDKENRKIAEAARLKVEQQLVNDQYGLIDLKSKPTDFLSYFLEIAEEKKASKGNYSVWVSAIKQLKTYSKGSLQFSHVDKKFVEGFKAYLTKEVGQNSADSYFNKFKATLRRAFEDRIIFENPAFRVKGIGQAETNREYLTIDEVQNLANAKCETEELKRAFLFSCYTGLRWSDVVSIQWKDIVDGDNLNFRPVKTTNKFIHLPLNQTALNILGQPSEPQKKIFNIKYSAHNNMRLLQWCLRAGITKHITFHCARHTFATLALTNGADLYVIQKLLGHSHIKTTAIYAKIVDIKKKEAVNMIPAISLVNLNLAK